MVTEITSADQFNQVLTQRQLVVAYFYGQWTASWKVLSDELEKFENRFTAECHDIEFLKLDVGIDEFESVLQEQGIRGVPSIFFYADGEQVDKANNVVDPEYIEKKISNFVNEYKFNYQSN
ncbi:Thioredoxin-1 [Wickerhamomyces ciferrii]|uniref:Thioredoxin-1 n=1 Tax=Wickerhamomyces ciferrii (strain ATCC 14091 / BCRC 22168 / CBS 111 / JCM 3599 / NBRC 0793 / NRRL Y-1031 F-60-10) TaxID=1206466 RepID=K0KSB2_WICCF|nr:Thioredoxin-1 [Wickerhamomyces ciferrii]CCH44219.1 Thioredoxin-1 [Wickerhamomyces ciferrii]